MHRWSQAPDHEPERARRRVVPRHPLPRLDVAVVHLFGILRVRQDPVVVEIGQVDVVVRCSRPVGRAAIRANRVDEVPLLPFQVAWVALCGIYLSRHVLAELLALLCSRAALITSTNIKRIHTIHYVLL